MGKSALLMSKSAADERISCCWMTLGLNLYGQLVCEHDFIHDDRNIEAREEP